VNKPLKRITAAVLAATIACSTITPVAAQPSPSPSPSNCISGGLLFGFFNGVLTTEKKAEDAMQKFKEKYGSNSPQGVPNCDTTQLAEGKYSFSLANYGGAQGSSASVQIASNAEGVLGTRTVTMGPATLTTPSIKVLDVTVAKDPRTGRMTARIGNQI